MLRITAFRDSLIKQEPLVKQRSGGVAGAVPCCSRRCASTCRPTIKPAPSVRVRHRAITVAPAFDSLVGVALVVRLAGRVARRGHELDMDRLAHHGQVQVDLRGGVLSAAIWAVGRLAPGAAAGAAEVERRALRTLSFRSCRLSCTRNACSTLTGAFSLFDRAVATGRRQHHIDDGRAFKGARTSSSSVPVALPFI